MRIAIYHNLPSGGAKRAVFETIRRLVQRHQIDVYTLSTANHSFCDLRPLVNAHYIFEFQPSPLFHKPLGRLNQVQRWRDLQRLEKIAQQIAVKIDQQQYDLVYVHPNMWIQAPHVLNYLQTPTVYHMHESLRLIYEPAIPRPYHKNGWREKIDQVDPFISLYLNSLTQLDKRNTLRATSLLANSRFTAANIQNIYKRQATTAYFGVDSTIFCPIKSLPKEQYVLSVGELRPNKGFDFLILALARIEKSIRPPLRIIGNANDRKEYAYLIDLAQENEVELTVEIMVDQDTLVQRYNQAALLVYAPVREPLGLVPLEAMACGTAVVAVAEGGVQETVINAETGLLTPRDLDAFAAAVRNLLSNAQQKKQMEETARDHVLHHWSWDKCVQQIETYLVAEAKSIN